MQNSKPCKIQKSSHKQKHNESEYRLFIGSIPGEATEQDLYEFFLQFGQISMIHVPKKAGNQVNAGYCKLTCANQTTVDELVNNTVTFRGRKLEIRPHLSDHALAKFKQNYNLKRVYIYNVKPYLSDSQIKIAFTNKIGPVETAYCIRNINLQVKRSNIPLFGYVLFKNEADAEKALLIENVDLDGCKVRIKQFTTSADSVNFKKKQGKSNVQQKIENESFKKDEHYSTLKNNKNDIKIEEYSKNERKVTQKNKEKNKQ